MNIHYVAGDGKASALHSNAIASLKARRGNGDLSTSPDRGQCGTQFIWPSVQGYALLPTKTSRLWTQSLGKFSFRFNISSQVSKWVARLYILAAFSLSLVRP